MVFRQFGLLRRYTVLGNVTLGMQSKFNSIVYYH